MPFPQYSKDYEQEVIITPQQHFLAEQEAYHDFEAPQSVILCFETSVMNHFKQLDSTTYRPFWTGEMIYLDSSKAIAIVGNFGIGGPAATHILEILIAAGVETFIVAGHAGGLQKSNPAGTIILSDKAIRDEGVSYHYLAPGKFAYPSLGLTQKLQQQLDQKQLNYMIGSSWTIDSMYRETKGEIKHYAQEGIATVEMELASLFAVATFRKVEMAAMLTISDYVAFEEWEEHLHADLTSTALLKSIEVARDILT